MLVLAMAAWSAGTAGARAYDFAPAKPLDTAQLDPALLNDMFGAWEIRNNNGSKRCRIVLTREPAIGGMAVDLAPDCARNFPVMENIAGWRLLENWTIDLIDPLRKTRVRFETPDNRYVAFGEAGDIAGMDRLLKLPAKAAPKPRR